MAALGCAQRKLLPTILTLLLGVLSAAPVAEADTQGPFFGSNVSTGLSSGGSNTWTNISNVLASDDADATASIPGSGGSTRSLDVRGFGFSIPATAQIDSIEIFIEGNETEEQSTFGFAQSRVIKGAVLSDPSGIAIIPTFPNDATTTIGPGLWGQTFTPADINSSDFGVTIRFGSDFNSTFRIDSIQLAVHFSAPVTVSPSSVLTEGQSFTASTTAGGTSYQWFKDGAPLSNGGSISGANTNTLIINPVVVADSGTYHATFDDGSARTTESVILGVFAVGTLPVGGIIGSGIVVAALVLVGAARIRRKD